MARVREAITIAAPAEAVWQAVHEDMRNFTRWTTNVKRVQAVGRPATGAGSVYRYVLDTPAGEHGLEIEHDEWQKPRRCAGRYVRGPVEGTWSYTYTERAGSTRIVYESDYRLTGLLRFMTSAFAPHYEAGLRQNLKNLKAYLERS